MLDLQLEAFLDDDALEGGRGDVAEFFIQVLVMAGDGDHRCIKAIRQ